MEVEGQHKGLLLDITLKLLREMCLRDRSSSRSKSYNEQQGLHSVNHPHILPTNYRGKVVVKLGCRPCIMVLAPRSYSDVGLSVHYMTLTLIDYDHAGTPSRVTSH